MPNRARPMTRAEELELLRQWLATHSVQRLPASKRFDDIDLAWWKRSSRGSRPSMSKLRFGKGEDEE